MNESAEPSTPLNLSEKVGNGRIPMDPSYPIVDFASAPILSARAMSSSHGFGTVYPFAANALTGYQIIDLTSALVGTLQILSPWLVRPMVDANSALSLAGSMNVATSLSLPSAA